MYVGMCVCWGGGGGYLYIINSQSLFRSPLPCLPLTLSIASIAVVLVEPLRTPPILVYFDVPPRLPWAFREWFYVASG